MKDGRGKSKINNKRSYLARSVVAISKYCFQNPRRTLTTCGLLFVASLLLGFSRLQLQMDWTYLFEADDPLVLKIQEARDVFPYPGDIAVLVDRGSPEQRDAFMEDLATKLSNEPELFHHIFYKFDLEPLQAKALFYLDQVSLRQISDSLNDFSNGDFTGPPRETGKKLLLKLLSDLDESLKSRGRFSYSPMWQFLSQDYDAESAKYLGAMLTGKRYVYLTLGLERVHVLVFKTGRRGEILAPQKEAVTRLREVLQEMSPTVSDLRVRLTGLPVMLNDEEDTVTRDGIRSGLISVLLISLVFTLGFGEFSRPILAMLALACGLGWTLAYTTLLVGHLNFITVSLATMLMGLGIDFGIHILFRFDEELSLGKSSIEAIDETLAGTGTDTCIGAAATATAFLALTMADFRGIAELGVIAAGGVMLCYLSTITVLPALLAYYPRIGKGPSTSPSIAWIEAALLKRARIVSLVGVAAALVSLNWATQVGFSYNLLEVQAPEISSVRTELEMIRELKASVLSAEVIAEDEEEARRLNREFAELPSVASVNSVVPLLPVIDTEKQALIDKITKQLALLELPERIALENANDLEAAERRAIALEESYADIPKDPELDRAIQVLREDVARMDPGPIQDGLSIFQKYIRQDLSQMLDFLKMQRAVPPSLEDLPEELLIRYVSPQGHHRLEVQAVRNIWEKENLEEFLFEIESVDSEILGHPVVQRHILDAFNRAFQRTPWYTLLGVLMLMLLYLRSVRGVFLALLPTATGVLMIFAIMGFAGIEFNVVNFVALPMSVGIGAVYGVHALHRMRELGDETLLTSSTGPALLLSGVTTMVGFASLMTAQHRGLNSLGFAITVGVAVNLLASLFFLPALRRALKSLVRSR